MLTASDRLDILNVITRADAAATRRDADAYVSFFTDDAVLDGAMGEHRGKEMLRQSVGPIWAAEGSASVHATLNVVVDEVPEKPDQAVATSLLVILKVGSPITIHRVSSIVQHLVKVESGWLVERRSVSPATA